MPDKLTERVKEILDRERKATPGPWVASNRGLGEGSVYAADDEGGTALIEDDNRVTIRGELLWDDANFAANARADVPWLAHTVERLLAALDTIVKITNQIDVSDVAEAALGEKEGKC